MDGLKRKIAALLSMTAATGCTEAEALAAAEKAARLMREHGLSEADITIGQASVRHRSKGQGARDELWRIVAYCTNTAATYMTATGERGAELVFVGRDPGPEIAAYLVAVLNRALDTAIAEFKAGSFYRRRRSETTRRAAVRDFTAGMIFRLTSRLVEIFGPQIDKEANALARTARDQRFAGSVAVPAAAGKVRFDDAAWSGWTAGNRVNLSHGVSGGASTPRQIGGA